MIAFDLPITSSLQDAQVTVLTPGWKATLSCDPFARLYFIEQGTARIRHHDLTHDMSPDHTYLIPAHSDLSYSCSSEAVCHWCHFTLELPGGVDLFRVREWEPAIESPASWAIPQLSLLRDCLNGRIPQAGMLAQGILLQWAGLFLSLAPDPAQQAGMMRFAPILNAIDTHPGHPWRIPELARMVHLTPTSFTRAFTRQFGLPPARYLLRRRIELSRRRLRESGDSVGEIAVTLGFSDQFHFSRAFHLQTGQSPTAYRRSSQPGIP